MIGHGGVINMKYGFIGAGNIAEALISGIINTNIVPAGSIYIYEVNEQRRRYIQQKLLVSVVELAAELIEQCEVVFLTVKPEIVGSVLHEIKEQIKARQPLIISIAAGIHLAFIEEQLGFAASIVRVMPNTNAAVAESMSLICANAHVGAAQLEMVENCFNAIGKTYTTTEDKMPILTALCGCAPAFTYLFVESLAKAAHKSGIPKKTAAELAIQTVLGSAKLLEQTHSQKHIWQNIDEVCSPGGMTIKGICSLEESGFPTAVLKAVEATLK